MREKAVGLEIRSLTNLIRRYGENSANLKYAESITGTNGWIIRYIAEHSDRDIYQKDLEEKFSITRSTASKVIKLMEQKGLIERCSVPSDARLKKLVLTPKAMALHHGIMEDVKKLEAALICGFTSEELDTFCSYIERMKCNINQFVNK